jgi:hypothetical protein
MSARRGGYRILDEPTPGGLAAYVVNPTFPLLAVMLAGSWLSMPWFAFNALALGSPTARREIALAAAALGGAALIVFALLAADAQGLIGERSVKYWLLIPTAWKLVAGYWLFTLQDRTFDLYRHFGGRVRNGFAVLLIGAFLARPYVIGLFKTSLWVLTVR